MEKLPVGKYIIKDTFKITGRGLVFAGVLTEGDLHVGSTIEFQFNDKILKLKITGIDMNSRQRTNLTGLLIDSHSREELQDLIQWKPENVPATIWK